MQVRTSHDFLEEWLVQQKFERGRAITCPTDLEIAYRTLEQRNTTPS